MVLTKKEAIKIQNKQIRYYLKLIKDKKKKNLFLKAVKKLKVKNKKARTGYDISRGVDIERLYFVIIKDYSDKEYWDYVGSLD